MIAIQAWWYGSGVGEFEMSGVRSELSYTAAGSASDYSYYEQTFLGPVLMHSSYNSRSWGLGFSRLGRSVSCSIKLY